MIPTGTRVRFGGPKPGKPSSGVAQWPDSRVVTITGLYHTSSGYTAYTLSSGGWVYEHELKPTSGAAYIKSLKSAIADTEKALTEMRTELEWMTKYKSPAEALATEILKVISPSATPSAAEVSNMTKIVKASKKLIDRIE